MNYPNELIEKLNSLIPGEWYKIVNDSGISDVYYFCYKNHDISKEVLYASIGFHYIDGELYDVESSIGILPQDEIVKISEKEIKQIKSKML